MIKTLIVRRIAILAVTTATSVIIPQVTYKNPVIKWGEKLGPVLVDRVVKKIAE